MRLQYSPQPTDSLETLTERSYLKQERQLHRLRRISQATIFAGGCMALKGVEEFSRDLFHPNLTALSEAAGLAVGGMTLLATSLRLEAHAEASLARYASRFTKARQHIAEQSYVDKILAGLSLDATEAPAEAQALLSPQAELPTTEDLGNTP